MAGARAACLECGKPIQPRSRRCRPCHARANNASRFTVFPITDGERRCNICQAVKPAREFRRHAGATGGRIANCRECRDVRDRPAQVKRRRLKYDRVRRYVDAQKARPCSDCGGRFPPECMDFDHVRGTKSFGIGGRGSGQTLERLADEVAKCEVVCANCHRIRSRKRGRYWGRSPKQETA